MLLFTFIENAFKYGVSPDEDGMIRIQIKTVDKEFQFAISNRIMKSKKDDNPAIGIDNCRKRLEILYPGRYQLNIRQENGLFKVFLTMQLTEK